MTPTLAAEGGYQVFELGSTEWGLLVFAACVGLLALLIGASQIKTILAKEQGTEQMVEIAGAIQEGALAYLKRQFRTIGIIVIPLAIVVFVTSTEIVKPAEILGAISGPGGTAVAVETPDVALTQIQAGTFRTVAFLLGCLASASIGFLGMWLAVRGNVRTAAAARRLDFADALHVAFRTGSVAGLFTAGLGLLGASIIIMIFQNSASAILVGFGFGGSLLALFLRVGGGIFT
ncbi:MAG: sodium/proton-translocating pyrophosphatase, partial [Acidimicrobiales bacterium]|nr:sodium/proton-translocating pyrophosphatase [Acidimicrobiales bacterium]